MNAVIMIRMPFSFNACTSLQGLVTPMCLDGVYYRPLNLDGVYHRPLSLMLVSVQEIYNPKIVILC